MVMLKTRRISYINRLFPCCKLGKVVLHSLMELGPLNWGRVGRILRTIPSILVNNTTPIISFSICP